MGNTDLTDSITPIIFDHLRIALQGELPLWNQYQFAGVSYGGYPNAHYFLPENLILFALFPEKYFFHANTFVSFVKFFLTGMFAFFAFARILRTRVWALMASLSYQFGLYTFWQLSVFDTYAIWLYLTIAIYLIYSIEERGPLANFLLSLFVFWQITMPNHLVTVFYAILLLGILALTRLVVERKLSLARFNSSVLAFAIIGIAFALRVLLTFQDYQGSHRDGGAPQSVSIGNNILSIRLFAPELFGFNFRNSDVAIAAFGPSFGGMHLHWASPHFFGALAMIFVVIGALYPGRFRERFWCFLALGFCAAFFMIHPAGVIFLFYFGSISHHLGLAILLPFPLCVAAAATARRIFHRQSVNSPDRPAIVKILKGIIWFVMISGLTMIVFRDRDGGRVAGYVLWILPIALVLFLLIRRSGFVFPDRLRRMSTIWLAIWHLLPAIAAIYFYYEIRQPDIYATVGMVTNAGILTLLVVILSALILMVRLGDPFRKSALYGLGFASALILVSFVYYPGDLISHDGVKPVSWLGLLGLLRFFLCGQLLLLLLQNTVKHPRLIARNAAIILIAVHALDLGASLRIHSMLSIQPFLKFTTIVPPEEELHNLELPDLDDYRVNRANRLLGLPYFNKLYGERIIQAGNFQVYNYRTAGGYYNAVPARIMEFISITSGKTPEQVLSSAIDIEAMPARQLLGIKYDYMLDGFLMEDDAVLSRFSFFEDARVVPDREAAVELLKKYTSEWAAPATIDLKRTLILEEKPAWPPGVVSEDEQTLSAKDGRIGNAPLARKMDFVQKENGKFRIEMETDRPGYLLFNDSQNISWRAYIDDDQVPIYYGNVAFMAVEVPAGKSVVEFRYESPAFFLWKYLTRIATYILLFLTLVLFAFRYWRRKKKVERFDITPAADLFKRKIWRKGDTARIVPRLSIAVLLLAAVSVGQGVFNYENGVVGEPRELEIRDYNIFPLEALSINASSERKDNEAKLLLERNGLWSSEGEPEFPQWVTFKTDVPRRPELLKLRFQIERARRGVHSVHLEGKRGNVWEKIEGDYEVRRTDEWQRFPLRARREYNEYRLVLDDPFEGENAEMVALQGLQLW